MKISRLLLAATGIQAVCAGTLLAGAGLLAALPFLHRHVAGTLDVVNQFAPLILVLIAAGAGLTLVGLERRRAKRVILSAAGIAFLVYGLPVGIEYGGKIANDLRAQDPQAGDLKLLQFNVLQTNPRPAFAEAAILRQDADILALQEPHPEVLGSQALAAAYPYRTACVAFCTLVIFSKRPIEGWGARTLTQADYRGLEHDLDVLWADTLAPDGRPVRIMSAHYVWPAPAEPQWAQRKALADFLDSQDKRGLILAGDLNLTPWSAAMRRQDARFSPLTRRTKAVFTWPAYVPRLWRPTHFTFLPIDHIYAGPQWKTVKVGRTARAASDHYPVIVVLRRAAAAASAKD